ncbi:Plant specific Rop nucleotide exchanger, PRONE [Cynara cardunculus var. scolymus]|uniref:Plant specific Rop nucleotide exchanger, PRONE n=1 Tax=Cynara cardunculus var. scolymus TaxID=59895 RepID=A0A103XC65_CYNCS|nr:Plant specific Rop nucleotide exchanger, PRONE [Cynara cardunculus var. scolymus]
MAASVSSSKEENDNNNSRSSIERCCDESYSLSADVSESESSSSFSGRRDDHGAASSSLTSSPHAAFRTVSVTDSIFPPAPFTFPPFGGKDDVMVWEKKQPRKQPDTDLSEIDMMKERFAKLLLGEDMSGGGKGVCTALAISNAITNLSASVFGELWRLEPLALQKKVTWQREMEWLLSVSDSIVELVPSIQQFPGGGTYEVMVPHPRSDMHMNLPALKKLDAMLIGMLDGFCDREFCYVDRGLVVAQGYSCDAYSSSISAPRPSVRQEDKWWLPYPKVPPKGLPEDAKKKLQQCRDCTNQILKAALAINSNVLAEMEIPSAYLETLPKNGKECLGDIIYRYITADKFSPECLLDCLDLSSEHHTLEVANRVEAAVHAWKLKERKKHLNHPKRKRSSWSAKVKGLVADCDKKSSLAQRAETLVMESLAFNIMARIDDVIFVDNATKRSESLSIFNRGGLGGHPVQKRMSPSPFSIQHTPYSSPFATPTFCSSPMQNLIPIKDDNRLMEAAQSCKLDGSMSADLDRPWTYAAGNLPSNAPERH